MSGRNIRQCLLVAIFLPLLAACLPADRAKPRQIIVDWPEQRLLFVADERIGSVRAFHLRAGTPVLAAQTRNFERSSVRDLQLDKARGQLWVLGPDGVFLHDARSLALLKRIALEARDAAEMRIEGDGIILLAAGQVVLGRIDMTSRLAVWRPALSVRRG